LPLNVNVTRKQVNIVDVSSNGGDTAMLVSTGVGVEVFGGSVSTQTLVTYCRSSLTSNTQFRTSTVVLIAAACSCVHNYTLHRIGLSHQSA